MTAYPPMTDFDRGRSAGYAEGSDSRIDGPLRVWRRELDERGLL